MGSRSRRCARVLPEAVGALARTARCSPTVAVRRQRVRSLAPCAARRDDDDGRDDDRGGFVRDPPDQGVDDDERPAPTTAHDQKNVTDRNRTLNAGYLCEEVEEEDEVDDAVDEWPLGRMQHGVQKDEQQ